MKKILIAGTAAMALAAATAQAAEPIKLGLGGYANEWVGFATNKESVNSPTSPNPYGKASVQDDIEINFKGSTALDNGATIAVEVDTVGSQQETSRSQSTNHNSKRAFITTSGSFGAVTVGEQDNIGALIHNSSPDVGGIGGQDGNWMQWVAEPNNHAEVNQRTYVGDDRTEDKVIYLTPAFYGLQAGISYTPEIDPTQTGHTSMPTSLATVVAGQPNGDLYVYGLAYNNTIGHVAVKADLAASNANIGSLRTLQGGLALSYAGFSLGGSAIQRSVGDDTITMKNALAQGNSWDAGLSYIKGSYGVSLNYFAGKALNTTNLYDTDDAWTVSGSHDLGPGIAVKASLFKVDFDSNTYVNKNDGMGFVTGLTVNF